MTSPVDTSVKHFTSEMAGAPILNGTAGAMIGILDACLVNGFDLKTLTSLVISGGVATATWTGTHGATRDGVILVAGSSIAALNGEQKVVSKTATTLTFATAAPDGAATGTITIKIAPAGWQKVFTGTDKAVYRSQDAQGTRMYFRVDDTGATLARVVGYETMSDIDTGSGAFPTEAQQPGGGYWSKSQGANTTANRWFLVADTRFFYWHPMPFIYANPLSIHGITRGFGDPIALKPGGDAYSSCLNHAFNADPLSNTGTLDSSSSSQSTVAMPRGVTGLGSAVQFMSMPYTGNANTVSGMDVTLGAFPSSVDGSLRLSRRYVAAAQSEPPRAELPGLWSVPQSKVWNAFKAGDTTTGTGALAGRRLLVFSPAASPSGGAGENSTGASFVDITGPWR